MIARYNVDLYLSGRAESIDLEYIDTLGPDAVPELLRLEKELAGRNGFEPPEAGAEFRSWKDSYRPANEVYSHTVFLLRERARELFLDRKYDPWRLTLSSLRAGRLLEEAGLGPNYLPDK